MKTIVTLSILTLGSLWAAAPTNEDDKAIAGSWQLKNPHGVRIYEIGESRNLKIVGGPGGNKRGRLMPQDDGSYTCNADGATLRFIYIRPNDQLTVEWYANKDDLKRKLPPSWAGNAVRIKAESP